MIIKRFFLAVLTVGILASCAPPSSTAVPSQESTNLPGFSATEDPSPTTTFTPTPDIGSRLRIADQALFEGDFALAQTEYQAALISSVDEEVRAAALWGLGQADMQAGNFASALDNFNLLISDFPDSPPGIRAHFLRGEILMDLERYTEAVEAFTAYLSLRPGVIDYYLYTRRGDALFAHGNYPEAIGDYQSALASAHITSDIALQVKLARAYEYSGDTVTALSMYDAIAAGTSNDYLKAQMDLYAGQLLLAQGRSDEAYARFLHSVENYPLAYDSYSALVALVNAGIPVDDLNRGLVDYFAGQYGYALEAFNRYIIDFPPNDGTAHYYRALALRDSGFYQEALDEFAYFIATYPSNRYWSAAWDEKAYLEWAYLDLYEAAAQTYLDFIRATSDLTAIPQALLNLGRIYERAGLLEQAASTWESIADGYTSSDLVPQALFWAGITRYRSGQYDQALLIFQRAALFATGPDEQASTIFWSGKTFLALGRISEAQDAFQQAASLDQTGYYSLRAREVLLNTTPFDPPKAFALDVDLDTERINAEVWLRVTFGLPLDTDLTNPGSLAADPRFIRGTECWMLNLKDEARLEFEDLRQAVSEDPAASFRLGNYLLDLGLYRPAVFAMRQVLTLAGMDEQSETLGAPRYFNLIRYGTYYQDLVETEARSAGFHPLFLFSVIRQESLYEGFVQSDAGARGLMQIIPDTGQFLVDNLGWPPDYTSTDLYRPMVSIRLGTTYLMNNRIYFNNYVYPALAAYNAGPGNAELWWGLSGNDSDLFLEIIRYSETRDYIRGIYEIYWMYQRLYGTIP